MRVLEWYCGWVGVVSDGQNGKNEVTEVVGWDGVWVGSGRPIM